MMLSLIAVLHSPLRSKEATTRSFFSFPDDEENLGLCTIETLVDTNDSLLRTDHGLYVHEIQDADVPDGVLVATLFSYSCS